MKAEFKSESEQLYELLSGTSDTYNQIGAKLGMSGPTVAKRGREMVDKYGLNPSILRTSKRQRYYGKYCHEIKCHRLIFVTASQVKLQSSFYCSEQCRAGYLALPIKPDLVAAYNRMSFEEMARQYGMSLGVLARLFEQYNIEPEEFPENLLVVPAYVEQRKTQRIRPQQRSSYGSTKGGFRKHLGYTVRSSWENNFCLFLKHRGIPFEYEPTAFTFPETTGARTYIPDFKMIINGEEVWCEIKGRIEAKDRTKMKRLDKHYPEVFKRMTYICEKPGCPADISYKKLGLKPFMYYNDLVSEYSTKLKYWE